MSGSAQWLLQQAVLTRLSGGAALQTLLGGAGRILDEPDENEPFPYLTIGEDTELPFDTMGTTRRDMTLVVHYWSRYAGAMQVKQIHAAVDALLDRWVPTVTGWSMTEMQFEFFDHMRDPDGITRHGVARYRVYASEE